LGGLRLKKKKLKLKQKKLLPDWHNGGGMASFNSKKSGM
jgi:hypothetical protein